jgi:hypothetical protein
MKRSSDRAARDAAAMFGTDPKLFGIGKDKAHHTTGNGVDAAADSGATLSEASKDAAVRKGDFDDTVDRLSRMPRADYDLDRREEAKRLGV